MSVDAIKPDTEPGLEKWLSINTEYAKLWPNITLKKEPPAVRLQMVWDNLSCLGTEALARLG